MRTLP